MNPFDQYTPKVYCPSSGSFVNAHHACPQDYLSIEHLLNPSVKVELRPEVRGFVASVNNLSQVLYDATDLLWWERKKQEGGIKDEDLARGIVGVMGERMLSLMMSYLLQEVSKSSADIPSFGVLREKGKHRGKGYIACFNNDYLLRFKGLSNFVILKKDHEADDEASYQQERFGLLSTEIDGLGYFHEGVNKYLLIGESSLNREFAIHSWDPKRHSQGSIEERVFQPLQSLFPHHELVYVIMGQFNSLFDINVNPYKLRFGPQKVYETLQRIGINTLFLPLSEIQQDLREISRKIASREIPL
jgi:hypothetical protein